MQASSMRHGTYAEVATRQVENQLLQHLSTPLESKIEGHAEQQRILKESLSHWRRVSTGGNVASGQVYLKWSVNDKMVVDLPRSAVLDSHGRLKLQQYERYAGIQIKKYACTSNAVTPHAVDFHDIRWIANSALTEASFSTDSFVWLQCEGVSAKQDESLEGAKGLLESTVIGEALAFLLAAIVYVALGPRLALDLWGYCHGNRKSIAHCKSYMWGGYFSACSAADYKLQLSLAKGSEFSSSIFVAAGLIILVATPGEIDASTLRWRMLKISACMLVVVSVLQALSGAIRTSCFTSAQRILEEFEENNVQYSGLKVTTQGEDTRQEPKCMYVLKKALGTIMVIPAISFWWMYRMALVSVLLYASCLLSTTSPKLPAWLNLFAVIVSGLVLAVCELYFCAYTYASSHIREGLSCGLLVQL